MTPVFGWESRLIPKNQARIAAASALTRRPPRRGIDWPRGPPERSLTPADPPPGGLSTHLDPEGPTRIAALPVRPIRTQTPERATRPDQASEAIGVQNPREEDSLFRPIRSRTGTRNGPRRKAVVANPTLAFQPGIKASRKQASSSPRTHRSGCRRPLSFETPEGPPQLPDLTLCAARQLDVGTSSQPKSRTSAGASLAGHAGPEVRRFSSGY